MKYLMIDTNIYIDMIVARTKSHKPESYYHLMKLLDYGEIRLIVPKIVITEVFRHLDNEVNKIGNIINGIKNNINSLYWVNNVEEIDQFKQSLKPVKKGVNGLTEEFEKNKQKYKENSKDLFNKIFKHKNTAIIDETENIVFKANQRSVHKLRPFHYGKDKDSIADSIIIETLINIEDLMTFNADDSIYFLSRNTEDFSAEEDKSLLHKDIRSSLESKQIQDQINYRILFTKTLLEDFKDETEHVGLIEDLEAEEKWEKESLIQESINYEAQMRRESGGLSSLSTDYEEIMEELDEVGNLLDNLQEFESEFFNEYEEYSNLYFLLEEELGKRSFKEILELITNFNRQKPLIELDTIGCKDEDDLVNEIFSLVHKLCYNSSEIEIDNKFKSQDYFELNNTLAKFEDFNGNQYRIDTIGDLDPTDGGTDLVFIRVFRDEQRIEDGKITINYGYLELTEDGNVGDGLEESIDLEIEDVIEEINSIKDEIISGIIKNKKILSRIIEGFSIVINS
ncbi:PIN domain-containing protein [Bacillus atrophaeus]|uniref:PIN domain-containing protein n=1 Tax=Bacillus atrophaeus TaxID=1452 RepID=UPI00227E9A00|nr:PIN domain-containing protein [Bacillus atrophaeus]MCY9105897.1 PIN domain-containing protein [Bacillus atrophaeus]